MMINIQSSWQSPISSSVLAQISEDNPLGFLNNLTSALGENLGGSLLTIIQALLIFIVGLIFANWFKGLIKKQLQKTDVDNKIAAWITGDSESQNLAIEDWIANTIGWLIALFIAVAVLNTLKLEVVSQPLNTLLEEVTSFLPRIGAGFLLLGIAWLIATVVKLIVTRSLQTLNLDQKLNQQIAEEESEESQLVLSETIANTFYWFIFLLFLPSILSVLQLEGTLRPLQELVNNILAIVPNILAAIIIATIGWVVAQIAKKIVTNLVTAAGINQIGEKIGLSATSQGQSLAQIAGSIVYILILIPIAITALDALQIQAISEPAIKMLNQVLDILPKLFAASVILALAYVAGQYVSDLVTNLLTSIGFNNIFVWLGFSQINTTQADTPSDEIESEETESESEETEVNTSTSKAALNRTPSELIGIIALVAIMLVASLTAVDILEIEALRNVVGVVLLLAGQVLVGVIIFGIGLYFANLAFSLIRSSGTRQALFLAQTARIAIIVLVAAMALERIGIAPNIVNLAFGLLTGGIAVAIALAFGLGGREVAGKALQEWLDSMKQ
jgi:hypothetical protein